MKKSILILLVLILANTSLKAQLGTSLGNATQLKTSKAMNADHISYSGPGNEKDYEFYMKRSKNHRIVGWSTLGAGLLLSGIGVLVGTNASTDGNYDESTQNAAAVMLLLGAVSGIVSIPFMITASVNKQKAKLMLDNQKTGFGVPSNVGKDIMGVKLVIAIGK